MLPTESVCQTLGLPTSFSNAKSYHDVTPVILGPYLENPQTKQLLGGYNEINYGVEHGVGVQAVYLLSIINLAKQLFTQPDIESADFRCFAGWDMTWHDLVGKTGMNESLVRSTRSLYPERYGRAKINKPGNDGDNRSDEEKLDSLNHPGAGGWGIDYFGEVRLLTPDQARVARNAAFRHHETWTIMPDCTSFPRSKINVHRLTHKERNSPPPFSALVFGMLADRLRGMEVEPREYRNGPVPRNIQEMQLELILNDQVVDLLQKEQKIKLPLKAAIYRESVHDAFYLALEQLGAVQMDARIEHVCLPKPSPYMRVPFHAKETPEVIWEYRGHKLMPMAKNLQARYYNPKGNEFDDPMRKMKLPN